MVSILVPAYNAEKYLPQCLDSILSQTYRDLQIVVIDDGSKDLTWTLMRDYAERDSRIEIYHQENQGVAETRNHLLDKIKGENVLFVDADDWLEPNMVEFLVNQASISGADIVTCGHVFNDKTVCSSFTSFLYDRDIALYKFLYHRELRGNLWGKLIQSSLLKNEEFCSDISYGEDALFCWRILQHVNSIQVTDLQLYHYRLNQESISHCSFGPKKMSSYKVWSIIVGDVKSLWPQYMDIACARFCVEMTLLLRDAVETGYQYDSSIKKLQSVVKDYGHLVTKTKMSSYKMRLYGLLCCLFYPVMRLL